MTSLSAKDDYEKALSNVQRLIDTPAGPGTGYRTDLERAIEAYEDDGARPEHVREGKDLVKKLY